jgi:hypothetical protein
MNRSCAVSRGERVVRGVISVVLAAFAVSNAENLWCAIPAGVCATFLMISAFTGWCPTDLIPWLRDDRPQEANTFGFPEARERVSAND